jgi:exopolysaccharide biosynthesis polyprenyl glycosylphosphotransferase
MLRQFRVKRIVSFFLIDWLGSLVMLGSATWLRNQIVLLPKWTIGALNLFKIPVGGASMGSTIEGTSLPLPAIIAMAILWPILFNILSVYDGRYNSDLGHELKNVFNAVALASLVLAGFLFLTYRDTSRGLFVLFFLLDEFLCLGSRFFLWGIRRLQSNQSAGDHFRKVLIVGAGDVGLNVARQLKKYGWVNLRLVGFLDDDPKKQSADCDGLPVLGNLDQVEEVAIAHSIQEVIIALPVRAYRTLVDICEKLRALSVRVHVIPDLFELSFPNAALDGFGGMPMIDLGLASIQGMERFRKRIFDVLVGSILIILLSPVIALVAVLIKLDSPGPVIYRQTRVGENGKPFTMLKFRSMRVDADSSVHQKYVTHLIRRNLSPKESSTGKTGLKMKTDDRVTRIGRFIRKASLDELPQFFNVVRGDMSLVGPRPSLPYEVELYKDWHKGRLHALPGLTGPWQVNARNQVSFDEMVRMDIDYIRRQSFWMDVVMLLKTPWVVLTAKGAG